MASGKGSSSCTACTTSAPSARSTVASSFPDQAVAVQDRQRVVAPAALDRWLVHLQQVVELEDLGQPLAVLDEPVEGREQRRTTVVRRRGGVEQGRVDPPGAADALDDGGLTRLAHTVLLTRRRRRPGTRDAERGQPPPVDDAARLLDVGDRVVGVDPLGEVPELLAAPSPGSGDLAAGDHQLQQHPDVAVVVPARRLPRHVAAVGQLAGGQRSVSAQPVEQVAAAGVVGRHPLGARDLPLLERPAPRPLRHLGPEQRQVLRRTDVALVLDQPLLVDRVAQLARVVRRAEAAPQHQVGARRDGAGRLRLEHHQVPDHVEENGRTLHPEQLGLHGDPPRVGPGQLVGHAHSLAPGPSLPSRRGRIRPSCAAVTTRVPSLVKIRPKARPRAPCADGDHWS